MYGTVHTDHILYVPVRGLMIATKLVLVRKHLDSPCNSIVCAEVNIFVKTFILNKYSLPDNERALSLN